MGILLGSTMLAKNGPGVMPGDTLYLQSFSTTSAQNWWQVSTQPSVRWNVVHTHSQSFLNLTKGNDNFYDLSVLTSDVLPIGTQHGPLELSLSLDYELIPGVGKFYLEIWDGKDWRVAFIDEKTFDGDIEVHIPPVDQLRFKLVYETLGGYTERIDIKQILLTAERSSEKLRLHQMGTSDSLGLSMTSKMAGKARYRILDMKGGTFAQGIQTLQEGENKWELPLQSLPSGYYLYMLEIGPHIWSTPFTKYE